MITSYAWRDALFVILGGAAVTVAVAWVSGWWALIPGLLTLALLSFYRDPPRRIPSGDNLIVAPADGKVVEISSDVVHDDGTRWLRIMIFLSVLDVHVNRSPCAGEVTGVDYRPGEFLNALNPAADQRNESNRLDLAPEPPLPGPIHVRQIAGVLARRIVCAARPGDRLAAGQRFGMIKLGSRTEVRVPADPRWRVRVRMGQHVRGGRDVLLALQEG